MSVIAPRDTVSKLMCVAAEAGVPYVLPNWYGHDAANDALSWDTFECELRLETSLQLWYEFSFGGGPNRYGPDFRKRSLTMFDNGDVKINTATWPQCGGAIARLFSLKELPA
ncbi:hypothetical protein BDV12DRAFT_197249 [Aspergillus spectabilis]